MVTACFGIGNVIATQECLLSFECSVSYFSRDIYFYFPGDNLNSVLEVPPVFWEAEVNAEM